MARSPTSWPAVTDPAAWTVADVYAEAMLGLCAEAQEGEDLLHEIDQLLEVLGQEADFRELLTTSLLSAGAKLALVNRTFGGRVSPHLQGLLVALARHDRLSLLPAVASRFGAMLHERCGILEVKITTAIELDEAQRRQIANAFSDSTGMTVELRPRVDESLLGGMVVRIGDRIIDGSIRRRLETLRAQVLAGKVKD